MGQGASDRLELALGLVGIRSGRPVYIKARDIDAMDLDGSAGREDAFEEF